jgi:lipoate-protein ligase B
MASLMLVRRTKPVTTPTRQLRFTSVDNAASREKAKAAARVKIDEQLKLISDAEATIDKAQEQIQRCHVEIEELLRGANMTYHSDGQSVAELLEQFTRQSRTIHPQKFRNKVTNEIFWKCAQISVTEALKFLTDREVNDLSDVIEPKSMGTVLKIKKMAVKRRK